MLTCGGCEGWKTGGTCTTSKLWRPNVVLVLRLILAVCERRRNRHLNRWRNGTDVCIEDNGYRDTKIYATFPLYELSHRIDSLIDRNISINDIRNFKKKKKKESLELQMKLNSTILKNTFLFRKINKAKKRTKKEKSNESLFRIEETFSLLLLNCHNQTPAFDVTFPP